MKNMIPNIPDDSIHEPTSPDPSPSRGLLSLGNGILVGVINDYNEFVMLGMPEDDAVAKAVANAQEKIDMLPIESHTVNRLEVIDHTNTGSGREFVKWEKSTFLVELSEQDDDRTLKIFLSEGSVNE